MAEVIFPETELMLTDAGGFWVCQVKPAPFVWEEGQKVRIVWNDVSYEKTVIKPDILGKQTHYYVGDMSILGIGDPTDDPFGIDVLHDVNYEADPSGVKTISLIGISKDPTATLAVYTADENPKGGDTIISYADFMFSPKFDFFPVKSIAGWKLAQKIFGGNQPSNELPKGYTRLAYLESTGEQYVDLEFVPDIDTKFELRGVQEKSTSGAWFGVSGVFYCFDNTNALYYGFCGVTSSLSVKTAGTDVTIAISKAEGVVVNGKKLADLSAAALENPTSLTAVLFGRRNKDTGEVSPRGKHRIEYCRRWQGGKLVGDFVPVLDDKGVPCMHNKVNGENHYNKGTGTFLYG